MQTQQQQGNAVGTITLFDTALLATAGVSFAVGVAPIGATLISLVAMRSAWRWHRDGIVAIADKTLTDSVQTYQAIKVLPQTAQRIAAVVQERTQQAKTVATMVQEHTQQSTPPADGVLTALAAKTHLLVVGHTGGGKSVLLHNLAKHIAVSADVLVCDVDSISGAYPGYRVVGAGDDYDSIGTALRIIQKQVEKRRTARANGTRKFKPLWMFIDEAHDVFDSVDGARELFIDVVRRGRKLNVHAVVGTQDSQVKTLGIEGQSKTLINLTRVDVELVDQERQATIDGVSHPIPPLASPDDLVVVGHTTTLVTTKPLNQATQANHQTALNNGNNTLLEALLESSLQQSNAVKQPIPQTVPNQTPQPPNHPSKPQDQEEIDQEIRDKLVCGLSKNKVYEWLREQGITQNKVKAYQMINKAMEDNTPAGNDGGGGDDDSINIDKERNDEDNS